MDERQLVALAREGDEAAFEGLVRLHATDAYNLAVRTLGDRHEAEDATQEAFLRAWRGLPRFRSEARFRTWLYRIVVNVCYDRLPRLRTQLDALDGETTLDLPDERQDVGAVLVDEDVRQRVHAAIDTLPDGYRMLIDLRHLQEMSYKEIADATGMPMGTVKVGIHRARRRLRQALVEGEAS